MDMTMGSKQKEGSCWVGIFMGGFKNGPFYISAGARTG